MKIDFDLESNVPLVVKVTFSRRNLLALLHKLDMDGSKREIQKSFPIDASLPIQVLLRVLVEENDEHYRGMAWGPMHPDTEHFIEEQRQDPDAA